MRSRTILKHLRIYWIVTASMSVIAISSCLYLSSLSKSSEYYIAWKILSISVSVPTIIALMLNLAPKTILFFLTKNNKNEV